MKTYIYASKIKTYYKEYLYLKHNHKHKSNWLYVSSMIELKKILNSENPEYIFFVHWSWKVDVEIINKYECLCFHMTDLPFGRGGTPLQNLIMKGFNKTKITALKMIEDYDAGPFYLKRKLSLSGSAQTIYSRAGKIITSMIKEIILKKLTPKKQIGKITYFNRRTPDESLLSEWKDNQSMFDFIRMLDADGYPRAFINYKNMKIEFSSAKLKEGFVEAKVIITQKES